MVETERLTGLLNTNPDLRGILFDLPAAAGRATTTIAASGLSGRCEAVGGDFFREVPQGGDAYLLKHVIHDWDDERAAIILRNCRRAMPITGTLLIVEGVYPPRVDQSLESRGAAANDVNIRLHVDQNRAHSGEGVRARGCADPLTSAPHGNPARPAPARWPGRPSRARSPLAGGRACPAESSSACCRPARS